jgi:DNA-binding transcriptional MerR regulator
MNLSLAGLAAAVNDWCAEHDVAPANAQAGECVTERNIRFYRTMGLVDAPEGGSAGYGEKHLLQLVAIRLLQAQGLPLRRIRELLYGRSLAELREIRRRGLQEARKSAAEIPFAVGSTSGADELWRMIPLDEDFLLVSRRGTPLTPGQRAAVLQALRHGQTAANSHPSHRR